MESIGLEKCLMFNCSNTNSLASASKRFSKNQVRCHESRFEEEQQQQARNLNLNLNLDVFKETQIIKVEAVSKPKPKPKPKPKSKSKSNSILEMLLLGSFVNCLVVFVIGVGASEVERHSSHSRRQRSLCSSCCCCCCHQYHNELETVNTAGNNETSFLADDGPYVKLTLISWLLYLVLLVANLYKKDRSQSTSAA